jgi:cytochrome c5
MKNLTVITAALLALTFAHCKTKQKVSESSPASVAVVIPGDQELAIAQTRWPNTLPEELKAGHTIYTSKCNRCHRNFDVSEFSEKKWVHEIDDMSPKAKLTPEEKLKLTKYLLAYRESKEKDKLKTN